MEAYFLGTNLRKIRKLHERKQTDIASCIGLSTRQYRKMENDEVPIKALYLDKLAKCYGTNTAAIKSFNHNGLLDQRVSPLNKSTLSVTKQNFSETQEFYEKIIQTKDAIIQSQRELIELLRNNLINNTTG